MYICCLAYITIGSRIPGFTRTLYFLPFHSYIDWIRGTAGQGKSILLNIILFIPLGYFLSNNLLSKAKVLWTCCLITIFIECIQLISYRGYFDVDDIINNCLGGIIGILIYDISYRIKTFKILSLCVLLIAGFIGCAIASVNTRNPRYETQFNFVIDSAIVENGHTTLRGECYAYQRENLEYSIIFKNEDNGQTTIAEIERQDRTFIATANIDEEVKYEIDVAFKGYKPIKTKTYVKNGNIEYVAGKLPKPIIQDGNLYSILKEGSLKVYSADYDCFVFQVKDKLYWLIGKDFEASLIYQIYTQEKEKLPIDRRQYGFDNKGFRVESSNNITSGLNCERYQVFVADLPSDYSITAVLVGMNNGNKVLWQEYFRIDRFKESAK